MGGMFSSSRPRHTEPINSECINCLAEVKLLKDWKDRHNRIPIAQALPITQAVPQFGGKRTSRRYRKRNPKSKFKVSRVYRSTRKIRH